MCFFYCLALRKENEEKLLDIDSYVEIIRDVLRLNKSICLARNFPSLKLENSSSNQQKFTIDIWPVKQKKTEDNQSIEFQIF